MSCGFDHGWWADRFYEYVEGQRQIIVLLEEISKKLDHPVTIQQVNGLSEEELKASIGRLFKRLKEEGDG